MTTPKLHKPQKMLRQPQVIERLGGVNPSTLWRWCRDGRFPQPVRLGPNTIAWREADVDEWLATREASSVNAQLA